MGDDFSCTKLLPASGPPSELLMLPHRRAAARAKAGGGWRCPRGFTGLHNVPRTYESSNYYQYKVLSRWEPLVMLLSC